MIFALMQKQIGKKHNSFIPFAAAMTRLSPTKSPREYSLCNIMPRERTATECLYPEMSRKG